METEQIISKLKESLEKDYGDYGRTNYIIEKLENKFLLPKSDYLYIDRMINLCTPIIEEIKKKLPLDIQTMFTSYFNRTKSEYIDEYDWKHDKIDGDKIVKEIKMMCKSEKQKKVIENTIKAILYNNGK